MYALHGKRGTAAAAKPFRDTSEKGRRREEMWGPPHGTGCALAGTELGTELAQSSAISFVIKFYLIL